MHFTPLIFESFDYAWSFSAELSPEGLIGITGSTLRYALPFHLGWPPDPQRLFSIRIFHIPKLGTKLKQDSIPLSYTPRKFITHPTNHYFYLIEGDHRVSGEDAVAKKLNDLVSATILLCIRYSSFVALSADKANPSTKKFLRYPQRCLVGQKLPLVLGVLP